MSVKHMPDIGPKAGNVLGNTRRWQGTFLNIANAFKVGLWILPEKS
jgi:hypothetical protein